MFTIVSFGDLWVNKFSVGFFLQLDLKTKNKTWVQLYRFGANLLNAGCDVTVVYAYSRRGYSLPCLNVISLSAWQQQLPVCGRIKICFQVLIERRHRSDLAPVACKSTMMCTHKKTKLPLGHDPSAYVRIILML